MNKIRINILLFFFSFSLISGYAQQVRPDTTINAAGGNIFHHTVERGQTVYSIATMYGVTENDIYRLNPGSKESIKAGAVLVIPQKDASSRTDVSTEDIYTYHTIQPKETLYSLTVKYNIPAAALVEANPGLSVETFTIGKIIRIPPTKIDDLPQTEVKTVTKEIEYRVQSKETMYSICRKFNVSSAELTRINPKLKQGVKAGMILKIPVKTDETVVSTVVAPQEKEVNALLSAPKMIDRVNTIKVVLMLPFMAKESTRSEASLRFIEYYEGLLLAVDSLRNTGVSIELSVFDTESGTNRTKEILKTKELKEANLIIGAVQNDQIALVAEFAKKHKIKYVIPFTSRNDDVLSNAYVFQVNTPHSYLHDKAAQLGCRLFANANIIFVNTNDKDNKTDYIKTLKEEMNQRNITYTDCIWSDENFRADITAKLDENRSNVIIPYSGSFDALNKIRTTLRSLSDEFPQYGLTLYGYPEWQTYTRDCLEDFFALNTHIYSYFYADNISAQVNDFYAKYKTWYSKTLINSFPKYGILGFDTGMYFLTALNKYGTNFENNLSKIKYKSLQTSFDFHRVNNWGGFINTQLLLVNYRKDFTITREEVEL